MFLDFNTLILKIILKIKKIILIYFKIKIILKTNYNHPFKHALLSVPLSLRVY